MNNNYFLNNSATYGNDKASYAIRLGLKVYVLNNKKQLLYNSLIENKTQFTILNQIPGILMNISLEFLALDYFNQTVVSLNQGYFINLFPTIILFNLFKSLCLIEIKNLNNYSNNKNHMIPTISGTNTAFFFNGCLRKTILFLINFCLF